MAIASLVFGILALTGTCIGLIPIISVINYCVNLPLSVLGTLLGIAHLLRFHEAPEDRLKGVAIAGLVLSSLALILALTRTILSLLFGWGVF